MKGMRLSNMSMGVGMTLLLIIFAVACEQQDTYLPKPRGYHRIELPPHTYQNLEGNYPYTFEYSQHAQVVEDTSFMTEPYWIEVIYPDLEATLSIAYKPVNNNLDSLMDLSNDAHRLTGKHHIRATAINDYIIMTPKGYLGVVFELEGDVPSQFQFYVTDSTENFLRAALYFPYSTKNDSLKPVIEFVKFDMMYMLNTIDWK